MRASVAALNARFASIAGLLVAAVGTACSTAWLGYARGVPALAGLGCGLLLGLLIIVAGSYVQVTRARITVTATRLVRNNGLGRHVSFDRAAIVGARRVRHPRYTFSRRSDSKPVLQLLDADRRCLLTLGGDRWDRSTMDELVALLDLPVTRSIVRFESHGPFVVAVMPAGVSRTGRAGWSR